MKTYLIETQELEWHSYYYQVEANSADEAEELFENNPQNYDYIDDVYIGRESREIKAVIEDEID